jgi:hypothetical protein
MCAPPQERQVKTQKPVLCSGLGSATIETWVANKVSIYIVKVNFSKIVAFNEQPKLF